MSGTGSRSPSGSFSSHILDGLDPTAKRTFPAGSNDAGNGRRPEEEFVRRSRIAWIVARRGRAKTAGHQTSQHRTETEAQRAGAFFDRRGLPRRGTKYARHPPSEAGHEIGSAVW